MASRTWPAVSTDAEQRDIAVQLAQQVNGVIHVVCKLECPSDGESNGGQIESNAEGDRGELTAELDRASFEGVQNDAPAVMQAYQPAGEAQAAADSADNSMMQRQSARNIAPQMRAQQHAGAIAADAGHDAGPPG